MNFTKLKNGHFCMNLLKRAPQKTSKYPKKIIKACFIHINSVCGNTMCLSSLSEVTASEKNPIAQLVSWLSLSEIMVQGFVTANRNDISTPPCKALNLLVLSNQSFLSHTELLLHATLPPSPSKYYTFSYVLEHIAGLIIMLKGSFSTWKIRFLVCHFV